eukprot:m.108960 g.108960  ORF g.108960 m.108960 type:complete len:405 (+) comp13988_c0_seq1:299-1513(+)
MPSRSQLDFDEHGKLVFSSARSKFREFYRRWVLRRKESTSDSKGRAFGPILLMAIKTLFLTLLWYVFSIGITFYNKWLFRWHGFHFPLTVTFVHMMITMGWAKVGRFYVARWYNVKNASISWNDMIYKVYPAGAAAALDIGLSNVSLTTGLHLNIYTVCKSTVLVFTLLFSFMFGLQKPSVPIFVVIFLVVGGVILFQAKASVPVNAGGFVLVMLASMFGGLRWVLTQVLMKRQNLEFSGTVDTLYHVAPCMALTLFPFAIALESRGISQSEQLGADIWLTTVAIVLFGACIAFCLTLSEFLLVSFAGSLTLSIAGIAKELLTVGLAACLVSGNSLTGINVLGLLVSIVGIAYYNYIKYQEQVQATSATRQKTTDELAMDLLPKVCACSASCLLSGFTILAGEQ